MSYVRLEAAVQPVQVVPKGMEEASKHTLKLYPTPTDLVSDFWREKYEKEAKRYWDLFYKRNSDKFFKDRHYLHKEWGLYFQKRASLGIADIQYDDSNLTPVILEIGCGVGNTLFPLLQTYPNLLIHACDFSPRAVNLVKAHKNYTESCIHAFVCDVTSEELTLYVPAQSVDVATMVFCLSAISPEKMPQVLQNIKRVLKKNGHVLIRDYASGDLAQERLSTKVQKISQNFYVRGDGTRVYYFTEPGLIDLFKSQGYFCKTIKVYEKRVENRAKEITMDRRWIQGEFCLRDGFNGDDNLSHMSTLSVGESSNLAELSSGTNEVDLSQDIAMFGVPDLEVTPVRIDGLDFEIKSIPLEFQHCCKATGLMLWESALVLATLLARNRSLLASKTVLELGCGSVGMCSMVAAMIAEAVVATDGDTDALLLLAENLKANRQKFVSANLFMETLAWGCKRQIEVVLQRTGGRGFDVILGSDVTYVAEAVPLLFVTAKALIAKTAPEAPAPVLLICHIERHVNEPFILDSAQDSGFFLEGKWPPNTTGTEESSISSGIVSMFPRGLEEAFRSHALVQLFCFRQVEARQESLSK